MFGARIMEIQSRDTLQKHIRRTGEKISRWRAWGYKTPSDPTPLLRESRPSGYSNWFVVERGKAIWWVYLDSSDGGSWSSEGIKITGYKVPYDETIAQDIYQLVYERMIAENQKKYLN
jgi:hypothetical protein